ncbi:MAG: transposase [Acidobacteriaceae bacterium]
MFSNRDKRTLLDKMILLLDSLGLSAPFYFVADAYYANGKTVRGLLAKGNHLVTRVKSNSVAYFPASPQPANRPRLRGRPTKYGNKILIAVLLRQTDQLQQAPSPVYGEQGGTLRFRSADLFWRPAGILVRFVAVSHPRRGTILPMSTDRTLCPLDIIRIYGLQFKIELSFKQALRIIGAYSCHFWMAAMTPIRRVSGNQCLHRKSDAYRNAVRRKIAAYHRRIPARNRRTGPPADTLRNPSQTDLAIFRILDPHHPTRAGTLRTGRRHRIAQYPSGFSRG